MLDAVARTGGQKGERKPVDVALNAAETDVDLGGVTVRTWTYTGTVPATEIRVRKGQTLRAPVANHLPQETSVHWHGLAIPNAMDGVPVLTQPAIPPGGNFTYEFVVPDDGTDYDDELVVVLDDWIDGTGTSPDQVAENLTKTGMKPMTGESPPLSASLPLGEDGGDVTYPYFLINGRTTRDPQVKDYRAGQRVRLRIINVGADTAFRVAVPRTELTVTHTDGYPVVAHRTNALILGMGERADAIITVGSSVPVIAAAEGKDGYAQINLRVEGAQPRVNVDDFVKTLRTSEVLNTAVLAPAPGVVLPQRDPDTTVDLRLAGPLNGYTWPINGKLYDPPENGIALEPNKRVRVRFISDSMMFHPMHLHGHTFQVVQPAGPGARKDTVLVPAKQTVAVDFDTDNPGRWIVHCHNDYHLDFGMATFVEYAG